MSCFVMGSGEVKRSAGFSDMEIYEWILKAFNLNVKREILRNK